MKTKPRNYRNNNKSESIDVTKVSKPFRGRYVKKDGKLTFVETTDK